MADDVMIFPDTWEEFEKHYGFYDSKQAYMYGNTRLIPSFRVQQWLDHIDDIKRKKQSKKNKMEQVAALFRKQIGEEFKLEVVKDNKFLPKRKLFTVKFTKAGLERLTKYNAWEQINCFIPSLLTGKAVVVND